MNKIFYFGSTAILAATMLTGCQSEDLASGSNPQGERVSMRVGLVYDNGTNTRTVMTPTGETLKCSWEEGDQVVVCDADGDVKGILDIVSGAGTETGYFESDDIRNLSAGSHDLCFHYLGRGFDPEDLFDISSTGVGGTQRYTIDLSKQNGKVEDLTKYDALMGSATVNVANGIASCDNMNLTRAMVGFAHFNITGVERSDEPITISSATEFYNSYRLNYDTNGVTSATRGAITIGGDDVVKGNDFYVAFVRGAITEPTFKMTVGGKEYSCTIPSATITAGHFYHDGTGAPIELAMETTGSEGPDHSKNPLLKWAESDLIKVSGGASATSKFADSPYTSGSYYQFGRNQGYTNGADAANNYTYCISNNYNSSGNVYRGVQGNTTPATRYAPSNPSNPSYFYIGYNMSGDYKTPVKTEDWETRAKANGYTYVDPLNDPEWRIPTVEDYYEILPDYGNGNHGFLGTGLYDGGTAQIKTLKDGTRCAFLWSANYTPGNSGLCLEILCKVIGNDVTSVTADDDEFWSDAEARYFKASGFIQAWYGSHSDQGGTQYIARPLDWGKYITQRNIYTEVVAYLVRNQSWMSEGGFYWTSDKEQKMFCFSLNYNYNTNIQDQLAFLQINGSAAANIRMIKK